MSARQVLPVLFVAVLLGAALLVPSDKWRWSRRPFFAAPDSSPRRYALLFLLVLLVVVVVQAIP